jgi:hypothetical protein
MSVDSDQKKLLMEMIEQILLNEKELESLKVLINEVSTGKKDSKQLKIAIIKSRTLALQRILDIFPFFHKRILDQNEIEKFTVNHNTSPGLIQELEEKNTFLEQIGLRIHSLLDTIQE